jgi:small-conductance mechanosensitive channel
VRLLTPPPRHAGAWPDWLERRLPGGMVIDWLEAAAVAVLIYLVYLLARRVISRHLARLRERRQETGPGRAADLALTLLAHTRRLLVLVMAVFLGSLSLDLSPAAHDRLRTLAIFAVLLQIAAWTSVAIDTWVMRERARRVESDAATATLIGSLNFVLKLVLWVLILLVALDNAGVNVTALVAGLGVGGIAVALALQNILGDLLASLSIAIDKPFVIGDTIQVDDYVGLVESVGLKSTRLRSVSGEQIIFSNLDLLKSRIRNHKRMADRRVVWSFGVDFETPVETIESIPGLVREILGAQSDIRLDRAHFKGIGRAALEFEAVYYVLKQDYNLFMDRHEAIVLALLRAFAERGIKLANQSETLLMPRPAPAGDRNPGPPRP